MITTEEQVAVNGYQHLTKSQRAARAAEIVLSRPPVKRGEGSVAREVAQEAGVGVTNIYIALAILKTRPELFERVKAGELAITEAGAQAGRKMRPARPEHVPGQLNRFERAEMNRMITGLSQIRGLCRGIADLDPVMLTRCLSKDDMRAWKKSARESSRLLGTFAARLGERP